MVEVEVEVEAEAAVVGVLGQAPAGVRVPRSGWASARAVTARERPRR